MKGQNQWTLLLWMIYLIFPFLSFATSSPYQENEMGYTEASGFTLKSAVQDLKIGGYLEVEGHAFLGPTPSKSTFLIRRARIFMTGTLYHYFGFMLMPRWDRHEERATLHYAWLETLYPTWAQIRMGLFKQPFSLEALTSEAFLNFAERTVAVRTLCQIEDLGIMVYGELLKDHLDYSLGAFNGRGRRLDNNNNKEVVGRIVYNLLNSDRFGKIYLGVSGATGRHDEDLSHEQFITAEHTPFWEWNDHVRVHSNRVRWEADVEWLAGPFYFSAEYLYASWGKIYRDSESAPFQAHGGYAQFSYVLTGEDKPRNQPLFPKHNFNPCQDQWGAFEVAARYEVFFASKKMIRRNFARGASFLHGPTLAFNWYLNPRMLMRLDGQYLWFNRQVSLSSHPFRHETVIVFRVQAFI